MYVASVQLVLLMSIIATTQVRAWGGKVSRRTRYDDDWFGGTHDKPPSGGH